jgi:hypothetical protein
MKIIPRNIVKLVFWSATLSLLLAMVRGLDSLDVFTYILTLFAVLVIWLTRTLIGFIKRRYALSKLGKDFKPYRFNKRDKQLFNQRPGFISLNYQAFIHSLKLAWKRDETKVVKTDGREMVIQYPVNPNLVQGDHYHILGIGLQKITDKEKEFFVLQGYCYEMKRVVEFEIDKIQQAFEYPSGLPANFSR